MKPVFEACVKDNILTFPLSTKTEDDLKGIYWKSIGDCKNGHIVVCYDIVKQPHCPVCEPGIDMRKHWTTIWGDPCPECGKM